MNKYTFKEKYSLHLKIAVFMAIIGIVFFSIGAASGGFKIQNETESEPRYFSIGDEIDNVNIDISMGNIKIQESNDFKFEITGSDTENLDNLVIESNGNEFSVTNKNTYNFFNLEDNFGINFGSYYLHYDGFYKKYTPKYTLYVPKEQIKYLTINNSFGKTEIDSLTLENLCVENDFGIIKTENISVSGNTEINNNMGDNKINNCTFSNLVMYCDMGNVNFRGQISDSGDFNISMGDLDITLLGHGLDDYNFNTNVDMGELKINGKHYSRKENFNSGTIDINVDCDFGSVNIDIPQ